jgi:hypothetical protein
MKQFYTYVYFDPKTNLPVYVGKGHGNRAWDHFRGKHHLGNLIKKRTKEDYAVEPKLFLQDSEQGAFDLEIHLISVIGRKDLGKGPLLNLTDGGEGNSGWVVKESTKEKQSISAKQRGVNIKAIEAMRISNTGRACKETTKQKIGTKNSIANLGKKQSKETIEKRAAKQRGRPSPTKGKTFENRKMSEEAKQRARENPNYKGRVPWNKGLKNV